MSSEKCGEELIGLVCRRDEGHDEKHQARAFVDDGEYGIQIVEWWSVKPNGDPVEVES